MFARRRQICNRNGFGKIDMTDVVRNTHNAKRTKRAGLNGSTQEPQTTA